MLIAVSTADGKTICGHLGKCREFIVYETDGKAIKGKRLTSSPGACPGHSGEGHNVGPFEGCHAVITQGMGQGMLNGLAARGIMPVITSQTDPDAAVLQFLRGEIQGTVRPSCSCEGHD